MLYTITRYGTKLNHTLIIKLTFVLSCFYSGRTTCYCNTFDVMTFKIPKKNLNHFSPDYFT